MRTRQAIFMSEVYDNIAPKMILGTCWGARDCLPFFAKPAKLKLAAETFHVHSFVALLSHFFLMWWFKILIECFLSNYLMNQSTSYFLKNWPNKNVSNFLYILPNLFDSTNLIKLVWSCISGNSWLVDWFN